MKICCLRCGEYESEEHWKLSDFHDVCVCEARSGEYICNITLQPPPPPIIHFSCNHIRKLICNLWKVNWLAVLSTTILVQEAALVSWLAVTYLIIGFNSDILIKTRLHQWLRDTRTPYKKFRCMLTLERFKNI